MQDDYCPPNQGGNVCVIAKTSNADDDVYGICNLNGFLAECGNHEFLNFNWVIDMSKFSTCNPIVETLINRSCLSCHATFSTHYNFLGSSITSLNGVYGKRNDASKCCNHEFWNFV